MRFLLALLCVGLLNFSGQARAQQSPPAEDFIQDVALRSVTLSPSGRYVAFLRDVGQTDQLIVLDTTTRQLRAIQAIRTDTQHLEWVDWKTDDRLLFGVLTESYQGGNATTRSNTRTGVRHENITLNIWRVFAIPRDGGQVVQMFANQTSQLLDGYGSVLWQDRLSDDPDNVLLWATDNLGVGVWRANINTGHAERVADGAFETRDYGVDGTGYPVLRMDLLPDYSGYRFLRRANGASQWTPYRDARSASTTLVSPDFSIVGAGPGPGQVYVSVRQEDHDRVALYLLDTATGQLSNPLQESGDADTFALINEKTHQIEAQCEHVQRIRCVATDHNVDRHFRALSAFLGDGVDGRRVGASDDDNTWLIYASGPTEAGTYYLYNRATANMMPIGAAYPRTPADLAPTQIVNYDARDGTHLWAYITARPGQGPRPTVILPHGGPEARDEYGYDSFVQFLASRGYVVVQPNFRGSGGFGRAFADAGRGQWGRLMQDDVTDAVRHVIDAGMADPHRICIVGASYGGYAALAGATLTPELYRCAVSIAGVSDLPQILQNERLANGRSSSVFYQYWLHTIGDPRANADALAATSPARLADRVTAPVLLIHGETDETVLINQSEIMERALRAAGKNVRFVRIPHSDHYWDRWTAENRLTLYTEVDTFLAQNLR